MKKNKKSIDFGSVIHRRENTKNNEKHLNSHRYHFTGQAACVYSHLQKGHYISSDIARDSFHISDLQRRIGDLGEFGGMDIDREYGLRKDGKMARFLFYFLPNARKRLIAAKMIPARPRWWYSDLYTPTEIIKQVIKNKQ